ncbi:AAA family ATPase [Chryseobacterium sp. JAH]|uniref:AAA family ATPase n=1 Tax=Chryseobacterium sp. JAH TaxID=1742858 RepID=UPI000741079F|nr:ATP-binding protein [Chryseobacterium sp. JAH]KUJ51822.1 AAA family ATPase [Chryseobacterium sp. JAH]
MSQADYIKDIAKYGLENDRSNLLNVLNELIEHSKKTRKVNLAIQLQSILKDSLKQSNNILTKVGSDSYYNRVEDREFNELILEKITSDYTLSNIVVDPNIKNDLNCFIEEHENIEVLRKFDLPVSNKILLHGPSGCGKTLASYIIAGELKKMMMVVNLGSVVSSKLGDTSKNLSKIFRNASAEDCIIFIDEFDSLGKVRDYNQDHGEMKRVVNTILQLFDYLPQSSIIIAATNQKEMIDDALLRRFDFSIEFLLPNERQINDLLSLTLDNGKFEFDNKTSAKKIAKKAIGLSYYSIQKTLITAIKRSLFELSKSSSFFQTAKIKTAIWGELIEKEKVSLNL